MKRPLILPDKKFSLWNRMKSIQDALLSFYTGGWPAWRNRWIAFPFFYAAYGVAWLIGDFMRVCIPNRMKPRVYWQKPFGEPKNPNMPTKYELIRLAVLQHCRHDQEWWWLPPFLKFRLTIKAIICVLFGLEAKSDRPRWEDLYGSESNNQFDLFWDEPVVVAMFGYNEVQYMEYTGHEWWELVVGHDNRDWRYYVRTNSAE